MKILLPFVPGRDISSFTITNQNNHTIATIYLKERCSQILFDKPDYLIASTVWQLVRQHAPHLPNWKSIVTIVAYERGIPLHRPGRHKAVVQFLAEETAPIYFAGDYLATATLEGAVTSGLRAVEKLMSYLPTNDKH